MAATGLDVFDKTLQTTNIWLDEIMEVIGPDRQVAWHMLGAVLPRRRSGRGDANAAGASAGLSAMPSRTEDARRGAVPHRPRPTRFQTARVSSATVSAASLVHNSASSRNDVLPVAMRFGKSDTVIGVDRLAR